MPTRPSRPSARKSGRPTQIDCNDLLNVAEKLFAEKGFVATTTREVVKKAKCNLALISYYFGSKDGLYQALILRHFECLRKEYAEANFSDSALIPLWPELKNPAQRLFCASMHEIVRRMTASTSMQKILCREMMNGGTKMVAAMAKSQSGGFHLLLERLKALQAEGVLRKDVDLRVALVGLMGPVVYSFVAAPILRQTYGFAALDEKYFRDLCLHQTRTFFEGWQV